MRLIYNVSDVYSDLFDMNHFNCIYAIKNLLDGRYYIGKCKNFLDRFRDNPMWSHLDGNQYIDNSIRYHGPENFSVRIIQENLDEEILNDLELKFIDKLHVYCWDKYWDSHEGLKQYNQVRGGNGYEYYSSLGYKSVDSRELEMGDSAWMMHTPEAIEKSSRTRTESYGSPNACCNYPEVRAKADATNRANHGGILAWNYPGQTEDMMNTQRKNHGGVLAFHTPEAVKNRTKALQDPEVQERIMETNRANHGGILAFHTKSARLESSKSHKFRIIYEHLDNLINKELELTPQNYYKYSWQSQWIWCNSVYRVFDNWDNMSTDQRWTPIINEIFTYFYDHQSEFGLNYI